LRATRTATLRHCDQDFFVSCREEHDTRTVGGEQQKLKGERQREKDTGKVKEIENKKKNVMRKR
jgi:surface antigen